VKIRRERMRIRTVTPVSVAYPEPNDDNNTRYLTLCRIEADDGTVGWGEAITQFPESTAATERLIEGLAPLMVGLVLDEDFVAKYRAE
jgi:L-alanine-DL-glutamate epimerase-like enolase superfamily enzyme